MARLTSLVHLLMAATLQQQALGSGLDCTGFGPLKVVFVIDGSGSLKGNFPHEWETARKLFQGFVDAYGAKYAAENIHVGIIQFNTKAYVERNMGLGLNAFDKMPRWRLGGTKFKPPIDRAASMINSYSPAGTEKARKLIVLLADGAPNNDCGSPTGGLLGSSVFSRPTRPEDCKPIGVDIMSVYIPTSIKSYFSLFSTSTQNDVKPLDIMRRLTPCTGLKEGTGKYKAEGAYGLDESGQRCPYLIISTGPHRYAEVQNSAKAFAQAVMDKIETPFYCKANEHVLRHKCVSCPGRPAGDNACAGDTPCASHEKPGTGSGGDKTPSGGSGGNKNPSGGSEGGEQPGYGSEGSKQPGDGSEGGEQPGYGSEGGEQPGYGSEGGEQPDYGSEGGEQPGYGSESGKRLAGGTSGGKTADGRGDYDSEGAEAASDSSEDKDGSMEFSDILAIVMLILAVLCVACCFAFYKAKKSKRAHTPEDEGFMLARFSASDRATRSSKTTRSTHRSGLQSSSRHDKTTTARKKRAKSSNSDRTKSSR